MLDSNDMNLFSMNYAVTLSKLLNSLDHDKIAEAAKEILRARDNGKNIFIIGNGGSAATASHLANDLLIGTKSRKKPFKAIALTDNTANLTAIGNDFGFESIFSKQLEPLSSRGDLLIAFSASGNSENIIEAIKVAKMKECTVIGISGFSGGLVKVLSDTCIHIESQEGEYGPVEDIHMSLVHIFGNYFREYCQRESGHPNMTSSSQLDLLEIQ